MTREPTEMETRCVNRLQALVQKQAPFKRTKAELEIEREMLLEFVRGVVGELRKPTEAMMNDGFDAMGRNNLRDGYEAILLAASPPEENEKI